MTLTKDKPVTNRDKSRSATPGPRDKTDTKGEGKGKQIPACPEFLKTGKCIWAERHSGEKCQWPLHLIKDQLKKELEQQKKNGE